MQVSVALRGLLALTHLALRNWRMMVKEPFAFSAALPSCPACARCAC